MTSNTAEAGKHFTFVNQSGKTIDMFFANANSQDGWGLNIFDTTPVYNGGSVGINLGQNARYWKFKVVYNDGSSTYWTDIDTQGWSVMTIRRNGSKYTMYFD